MAETRKEFYISIGGIKESIQNLETLEGILDKMEKQVDSINKNGGFSVVSKEANKNTKEAIDLAKAEEIANNKVISSYKEKQTAMRTLGKEIKSMTVADGEAAKKQQEMINQYNGLNEQLKRFDASMGNHQRNVGNYSGALKAATAELKSIKGEMVGLEAYSDKWNQLAEQAGQVKDRIGDINQAIKRNASDTKTLDDAINIAKSATAAFTLYKGAMASFGFETKEAEESMQELMAAMSMVQSLQTLSDTLQSSSATAELFQKAMKALGLEFLVTKTNATAAAASTTALATAENGAAVATNTLSTSAKALRIVLASLGIGLVILLVTTLIAHWEDLVGWFDKTFPIVKKLGGVFNGLKAVFMGVGKAIVNFLINPFKTFANVIQKIFQGDFKGAIAAIGEGIKNQFVGAGKAFKEGFQDQVERGLEEITLKTVEETNKQTKQQLAELKIQERNNKTYSKKYIDLQKKDFAERKRLAKGNKEELDKIKLEEMQFFADVEDKKTAAAKAGASARAKIAKDTAKEIAEEEKRKRDSRHELTKSIIDTSIAELKIQEEIEKQRLETYKDGPIEKYTEQLKKLQGVQDDIKNKENAKAILDIAKSLESNVKTVKKLTSAWVDFLGDIVTLDEKQVTEKINALTLNEADRNIILTSWQKLLQMQDQIGVEYLQKVNDNEKQGAAIVKSEIDDSIKDFEKRYKKLIDTVEGLNFERPVRNMWGIIDTGKTLANLEILKSQWEAAYEDLRVIIDNQVEKWNDYLERVKAIYGEDSNQFKKAQKEKEEALDPLIKKLLKAKQAALGDTSTETDYTGDNKAGASTKPKRKLWYGKNDKKQDGSQYTLLENLSSMFDSLDEMVLAPAMDTFSMFMDFAIEETQQKLEEVEKMHDDALEKVEQSADKIKELNDSLKDSSNTNTELTKQQLADEQLLYAQRLAEEKKLAEEEKNLKNKAASQEANAKKMELRYQMVMAIANTAQGASKALADWGWPLGSIFAGIMAALGAVQVGLIASQIGKIKPVKYAEGGLLSGPSHSQGGIKVGNTGIEVEGNEFVVNKRSTKKFLPLLEAINAEGNKRSFANTDKRMRKYANGGQLNFEKADSELRQQDNTNRLISAIDGIDMQPVVAVKDIWKAEDRLIKVRSLAGR